MTHENQRPIAGPADRREDMDPTSQRRDPEMIAPGAEVITSDGRSVGHVKDSDGQFLLIDAPMQPDYWINKDLAASGPAEDRIILTVDSHEFSAYQLDQPGPQDSLVPRSEQEEQRERMERELAAQREQRES